MTDNGDHATSTQTQEPPSVPPAPPTVTTATQPPGHSGRGGGGATAGVILILLGAALLLTRFAPGVSIWHLWPFFVIVPGIVQCLTPGSDGWSVHRFFDGLVTISFGLLLLGNSTGYISWGVWWEIVQLWPILLISAGLSILGKAVGQSWLRVLGTLIVIAALAFAAVASMGNGRVRVFGTPGGQEFAFDEPLAATSDARLELSSGVGEIVIDSMTGRSIEIDGSSPFGEPKFEVNRSGRTSEIDFALTDDESISVFPGSPSTLVRASLSQALPWEIVVDSGVSTLDADLSDLEVSRFELKTGVSSNTVRLGDAPESSKEGTILIESGVGSVDVLVPRDAQVRVESDSGLTGVDISRLLDKTGDNEWQTPGFADARRSGEPVWIITAKSGIGSFAVRTY